MAVHARRYRLPRQPAWLASALRESPALPAQVLAVGAFVALGAAEAGFYATAWCPAALFLLALVVLTAATLGLPVRPPRSLVVGLVLFAAYCAWSLLSITWADQQAEAWAGANRTIAYLLVLVLFALWPVGGTGARLLLALLSLGIAAIGLVEILRADAAAVPDRFFIDLRFSEPAGYINANVALWTLGMLGCLATAAARRAHPVLRGVTLGGTALLAGLALLGQSRGWLIALPLALIVLFAFSPDRLRIACGAVLAGAGVLAVRGPLLAVHDDYTPARFDGLVADATATLVLMAVVVGLGGAVWAGIERRVRLDAPNRRRVTIATGVLLAALALAGGAAALNAVGDPVERAGDAWSDFKEGGGPKRGASRFASGGSNRYDFWTVAWDAFRDHPVRGIGAENFQELYLRVGSSTEKPRYPHSLLFGVLSQLGIVGASLLAGGLGALLVAAAAVRRRPAEVQAAAAAALGVFAYWFGHASVDWLWEFPGLTAPALAMLGTAAALATRSGDSPGPTGAPRRPARRRVLAVAAPAIIALALCLGALWLSALYLERGAGLWREDPQAAFDALDRAAALNPLSAAPDATAGTIALRLGRTEQARRHFLAVLDTEPDNAYAALELGLIAAAAKRREEAVRQLRRSLAQNPNDGLVRRVLADVRAGRRVSPSEVNAKIVRGARSTVELR
jgi:tetratricopeptide (TPR) repeat protein